MVTSGTRLRSQVCDTEVIVVRPADSLDDLRAGGVPMVPLGTEVTAGASPHVDFADGNVLGKRYVDDTGAEILVTKPGAGALSIGTVRLTLKGAAPLPASD
ncbi:MULTISPECIES: hypothetical protein [unclassified Nocardia]|uniref:hypothetical protein n=1 Tax=unclassified Nocardia TaxID=2637762 RepID=UPI0033A95C1D